MVSQSIRDIKVSAIVIAAAFAVFALAFSWLQYDMAQRADAAAKLNDQIDLQTRAVAILAQNKEDAPIAATYQKAMDALIPSKNQILDFSKWLDAQGRVANVSTKFSLNGNEVPPQGDTPGHISFTADVSGNASDVTGFLSTIETRASQYLIGIDTVDAQQTSGGYTMAIQGRLFFK